MRYAAAVAEALAEERERELAEARAFRAAQEARDTSDALTLLGLSDSGLFLPRRADFGGTGAPGAGDRADRRRQGVSSGGCWVVVVARARAAEPHIGTAPRPFGGAARTATVNGR